MSTPNLYEVQLEQRCSRLQRELAAVQEECARLREEHAAIAAALDLPSEAGTLPTCPHVLASHAKAAHDALVVFMAENAQLRAEIAATREHKPGCASISHRRSDDGGVTYNWPAVDCSCGTADRERAGQAEEECARLKAENSELQLQLDVHRDLVRRYEEDTAVCPEDRSVTETVNALRGQLEALHAQIATLRAEMVAVAQADISNPIARGFMHAIQLWADRLAALPPAAKTEAGKS